MARCLSLAAQIIWAADANDAEGPVDYVTPDGIRLRSQTVGLAFTEAGSGRSVWIGELRSSIGQQTARNEIIYRSVFSGIEADLRYRLTDNGSGFHSDLILRERPTSPMSYGLNPDRVLVEVWTEFLSTSIPPTKRVVRRPDATPLRVGDKPSAFDEWDEQLNFGCTFLGQGQTFHLNAGAGPQAVGGRENVSLHVKKEWTTILGKTFLIESIPYRQLAPLIGDLPQAQIAHVSPKKLRSFARHEPLPKRSRPISLAGENEPRKKIEGLAAITRGQAGQAPGYVLDFDYVNTATNFTFRGDRTYVVSSNTFSLSGPCVLEGGTIIKMASVNSGAGTPGITFYGPVECRSDQYRPVVVTSVDDATVGESTGGSTPSGYYGYKALLFTAAGAPVYLHDIRFRYLYIGCAFDGTLGNEIRNAQFYNCYFSASAANYGDLHLGNALITKGAYGLVCSNNATIMGEHLTVTECDSVLYNYPNDSFFNLTNSIFASNTNGLGSYQGALSSGSCANYGSLSGPFQTVGKGAHYLSDDTLRGTSAIRPELLRDLGQRTTHPPIELTANFSYPTTLGPQAQRDTRALPSLGYHYDPLDWVWTSLSLTNAATLTLTNGVAVGIYGPKGVTLRSGTKLISEGTPLGLNHLVRYQAVQEQGVLWGSASSSLLNVVANEAVQPEIRMRFTDISLLADTDAKRVFLDTASFNTVSVLALTDSQLRGVSLILAPFGDASRSMTLALTNSFIERAKVALTQGYGDGTPFPVFFRNNLFRNSVLTLNNATSASAWGIYDNLFDSVSSTTSGNPFANGSNAYYNPTNALPNSSGGDKTLTAVDYQSGPLGPYYYPSSGGNLSSLIDAGSRNATNAGLFHYTTLPAQTKEGASQVDIGRHYPAYCNFVQASEGFSSTQGAHNWSYRYASTGQGLPDTYLPAYDPAYEWWGGTSVTDANYWTLVWRNGQHPGGGYDSVRSFASPFSGNVSINGTFMAADNTTDGVRARILKNNTPLLNWVTLSSIWDSTNLSSTTPVAPGDLIHFQVNRVADESYDGVIWDPSISYYFKASDGFSSTQGANQWYYRYASIDQGLPDAFLPTYDGTHHWWGGTSTTNANYWTLVWNNGEHPGGGYDSVRTFVAPYSGMISITGDFIAADNTTDGVRARILKNNGTVVNWVTLTSYWATASMAANLYVSPGDQIHFQVNRVADESYDGIVWDPTITYDKIFAKFADADGDGIPDYLEDANGNGTVNTGESDWKSAGDSDGDGLPDDWERFWFGDLNQGARDDWDADGLNNGWGFHHGIAPPVPFRVEIFNSFK